MVFYITLFLIFVVAWCIIRDGEDSFLAVLFSATITTCLAGLLGIGLLGIILLFPDMAITREGVEIKSIKTESSINGSFFLGTGGFDSSKKYYSYTQSGPGYVLQDFPANSVIIESNSVVPNVSWDLHTPKSRSWLYPDWLLRNPRANHYQIVVPEGTIISEYRLN